MLTLSVHTVYFSTGQIWQTIILNLQLHVQNLVWNPHQTVLFLHLKHLIPGWYQHSLHQSTSFSSSLLLSLTMCPGLGHQTLCPCNCWPAVTTEKVAPGLPGSSRWTREEARCLSTETGESKFPNKFRLQARHRDANYFPVTKIFPGY